MLYFIDSFPSKLDRDKFNKACDFVCLKLDISVDVYIKFSMLSKYEKGYADYDDCTELADILINRNMDFDETVKTLFHEMVHIKQYSTGWLIPSINGNLPIWQGKEVDLPYREREWENDAYSLEEFLFMDFQKSLHERV
jgi:hypothetical protein